MAAEQHWLNKSVYGYGVWPDKEKEVLIADKTFVLCPLTRDKQASIHIDLLTEKISLDDAVALMNRFLSHLSWFDHQPYWLGDGFAGGVVKQCCFDREQQMAFSRMMIEFPDVFDLYEDALISRALAFYRQAQIAEQFSLAYACLSYYKILEIEKKRNGPEKLDEWINQQLPGIKKGADHIFPTLDKMASESGQTLSEFFFKTIRAEAAHYIDDSELNLDEDSARRLFGYAVTPLEDLATLYIKTVLGVDDHILSRSYSKNSQYALQKNSGA